MDVVITQRLKKFIEKEKISSSDVYKKIGTSRSTWSGWLNEGRAIPVDKFSSILNELPKLNARWLLTGKGKMLNNEVVYKTEEDNTAANSMEHKQPYGCDNPACKNQIDALKEALDSKEELLEMYRGKKTKCV